MYVMDAAYCASFKNQAESKQGRNRPEAHQHIKGSHYIGCAWSSSRKARKALILFNTTVRSALEAGSSLLECRNAHKT